MVNPTGYTALDLIGYTDKGIYSPSANYVTNDLVHYGSNIWRCLADDTTGITPTEGATWTLFIGEPTNMAERMIAPLEVSPSANDYVVGEQLIFNDTLYKAKTAIAIGDTLVVGTNIELAPKVSSQIQTLANNDDAMLNVLGAKNLLPNKGTTQTLNGITFTVNPDGSVTVSGTAASSTPFIVYVNNFTIPKSGKYIVSGNPNAEKTFMQLMDKTSGTNHVFSSVGDEEYNFDSTHVYQMRLAVVAAKTVNETFYPMIRDAKITDDTYVPYAKTNKQLTDDLDILEELTYDSTKGTITGYYTKVGHVVTVSFRLALAVAITNNTTTDIGRITKALPPSIPIYTNKQITWTARDSSRGGYIQGYVIIDPNSAYSGTLRAETGTAQVGDVLYITFSYITS